jgi:hypothetical protein
MSLWIEANGAQFDCHHFKQTNDWLVQKHGKGSEIDWNLATPDSPASDPDDSLFDNIE